MNITLPRKIAALALAVAPTVGLAALTDGASAKGREVITTGTCTNGATWKLKAKDEDFNRIGIEFEVDANRTGQVWAVAIYDNGIRYLYGTRTTLAPSGSFTVRRIIPNRAGVDHIGAFARRLATGATCAARINF